MCMVHRISNKYNRKQMSHSSFAAFKRFAKSSKLFWHFCEKNQLCRLKVSSSWYLFYVEKQQTHSVAPGFVFLRRCADKTTPQGAPQPLQGPYSHLRGFKATSGAPTNIRKGSASHIKDPRESQGPDSPIPGGSKPCQGSESHLRDPKR